MLALKLLLVPSFLLLVSLAGSRWGPAMAGWLAGMPVVAGPILFFLALELGSAFAAQAAVAALSAVLASVAFSLVYAHGAQRRHWPVALAAALLAWLLVALGLSALPQRLWLALVLALLCLGLAPRFFPAVQVPLRQHTVRLPELALRMAASALLTLGLTLAAGWLGPGWTGLLAVFPILGTVLAVFSHLSQGAPFATTLLRAMVTGQYAFVAFCAALAAGLQSPALAWQTSFILAALACLVVQASTRFYRARTP